MIASMTWRRIGNWCVLLGMLVISGYGIAVPMMGVEKILFIGADEYYHNQLYTVNPDGSALTQITNLAQGDVTDIAVSPDGASIALVVSDNVTQSGICVMNAGGSNYRRLTLAGLPYRNDAPVFSKNGKLLYFSSDQDGQSDVYSIDLAGAGRKKIWHGNNNCAALTVSPDDGTVILHSWPHGAPPSILRLAADGTSAKVLVANGEHPAVSSRGDLLAYYRFTGDTDLYISHADGSQEYQVTHGGCNYDPAFSPQGNALVFCAFNRTQNMLCTINIDGTNSTVLVPHLRLRPVRAKWVRLTANPVPQQSPAPWGTDWNNLIDPPQPDLMIGNGVNQDTVMTGEHIYDTTGQQCEYQNVPWGVMAVYRVVIKNAGGQADQFLLKGASGAAKWTVRYYTVNGRDITREITGMGVRTPVLAPGDSMELRLEVTAASSVKNGDNQEIMITTASSWDAQVADSVDAVTTKVAR